MISTGVLAIEKVESDILSAKEKGQAAFDTFVKTKLSKEKTMSIFDPIKKMDLSSFSSMNKTKTWKVNSTIIPVQASKELFAKISLVAHIRSLDMRSIFKFPLGPLPWALAEPMGTLKKTSKATFLHKLEGPVEPLERVSGDYAMVFDGMVTNKTFGQLSTDLLEKILTTGSKVARIDVVFDVYCDLSIKNVERKRRSKDQLLFKSIIATSQIKQWGSFLSCNKNKNSLVEFFVSQWKNAESRLKIGQKTIYVTSRSDVYKINDTVVERVLQLQSNHEEADTRMLLHAKHASFTYPKVLISSPDTDVFIIFFSVHTRIAANLYFLTGVKRSRRIIDVSKVADYIFDTLKRCDVSKEVLMESLIGFHSFTGCDTISAFTGRGSL